MTTRKINGKLFTFPDGWHDVSFDMGHRFLKGELKGLTLFSELSGVDQKYLENDDSPEVIEQFLYGFPFLATLPLEKTPEIPISIKINGHNVFFPHVKEDEPFDFGKATVGQIEEMDAAIKKHYKGIEKEELSLVDVMEVMPLVVAMYVQPFVNGTKYDTKKARKLSEVIKKQCSVKEVINIYQFFFQKLNQSENGQTVNFQIVRSLIKKFKRAFMRLINYLAFMRR